MVFVHRSIAPLCSVVTSAAVACGAGNTLGNKGAVSIFLKICGTRILVVNAHLSAHQHAERRRNAEFKKISSIMPLLLERKERLDSDQDLTNGGNVSSHAAQANSAELGDNSIPAVEEEDQHEPNDASPPVQQQLDPEKNDAHVQLSAPVTENNESDVALLNSNLGEVHTHFEALPPSEVITQSPLDNATGNEEPDEDDDGESESETGSPVPHDKSSASIGSPGMMSKTIDKIAEVVIFMGDLNYRIKGNR